MYEINKKRDSYAGNKMSFADLVLYAGVKLRYDY